jgi:membrane protease YdiL (CAAX protease family)
LRQWLNVAPEAPVLFHGKLLTAWIVAVCLQPALVEELYFRCLLFGALRSVMGGHAVVWVTAAAFAIAHIGTPLSMPVLFLVGILLGYARLGSGRMWLPMVLHFLHNAAIVAMEQGVF